MSEKLIRDLADEKKDKQSVIRKYFILIHERAVDDTLIAVNRKNYLRPNFDDLIKNK